MVSMSVIHKCDACKKAIISAEGRTTVDTFPAFNRYEFCSKCAAPIRNILKKYKLITQ